MTRDDLRKRRLQPRHVQRALKPYDERVIVGRGVGLQLLIQPDPLLNGGEPVVTGRRVRRARYAKGRNDLRLRRADGSLQLWPEDPRSEEHTSELQSRENLVCRLLLEKKKDR